MHTGFWWGNLRGREHLEDPGVDGTIKLRWLSRKWNKRGGAWTELIWLRLGQVADACECGNEALGSIKC